MPLLPLLIASTTLLPGLWEYSSGLAGLSGKTEQKCLRKSEVEQFLTDPSNRHYDCKPSARSVGDGRVRWTGVCTSRKHPEQHFSVSLNGTYTPETFRLKGKGDAPVFGGLQLPVSASITAHRLSADCPAAAAAAS
jgi:hypothetical protein